MFKAFSKLATDSLAKLASQQLRKLRRKAFEAEIAQGFQRLEPRRVLTVQAIFDPGLGSLSVDITAGGNTQATLAGLDASQFFVDTDGNAQFDLGVDLLGDKSLLRSLAVNGTSSPLGNLGEFIWNDQFQSNWALDQVSINNLNTITLDVLGQTPVAQDALLSASNSIQLINFSVAGELNVSTVGGSVLIDHLQSDSLVVVANSDILQADSNPNDFDIYSNHTTLISQNGSIDASVQGDSLDAQAQGIISLKTDINGLTATSASDIFVNEANGIIIEQLLTTSNGSIKVLSLTGDIVVDSQVPDTNAITANGSGDILLQTLNSGTVVLNSTVATGSGNITLAANDSMVIGDYLRTAAPGSIFVRSGGSVSTGDGGLSTNNANLALFAAGDISLGAINAGTGNVYLDATGSIARITPGKDEINITASTATLIAGVKIGDADPTNIVNDYNFNAITTNVATLAARSATGIYIFEQTGVTVDRINTSIAEVHFNSTTTNLSTSTEDLVTTNQGPIKLLSLQGDIVINPGTLGSPGVNASGAGDVLLQTGLSGTLIANADIVSGSGDINIVTRGDLAIGDRLKTIAPGTIYLSSQGSVSISSMNIQGVELGVSANDDILVGQIDAGNAKVWLSSAANIFDSDNFNSTINITASAAILRASEKIGNSGVGTSNSRAITTRVETLSANADNGIYLQEQDGLSIDRVTSTVQRVYFNSNTAPLSLNQEDLTTSANGPILLQSLQGDIVVLAGTDGEPGIWANGTGNVLLQTVSSGTIRAEADVRSDSGHITLNSFGDLVINEHIRTSRPGTIYLVSQGAISIESLTTNNTNLGVSAVGDIQLGSINAGTANVFLTTPGRILDNAALNTGRNITASGLTMFGEDGIGLSDTSSPVDTNRNAITTAVSTLSARSSGGIYVQELDGVSISTVVVPVRQVNYGSGTANRTVTREDLVTTLNTQIKLQSIDGDIVVNAGTSGTSGVLANGSGDILLQTLNSGTVVLNSTVQSGSGDITIIADDSLNIADRIRTNSQGTIVLRSDESVSIGVGGMSTNNASLGVFAAGDIQVGSIQAGTGRVLLDAAGNISRITSGSNETNITGSAATLLAGGRIGDSDLGNINADSNRNAITTNITTLAARSGTGIFVSEQTGVTVDRVVTTLTEVHFNSTRTTLARATEDLTTTNNGSILLQSLNGDIVVRPGTDGEPGISANGTGNILLQTLNAGTILTQADVRSGSGHITLSSFDDLVVNERLQTSGPGTIYLNSVGTVSVQSLTTNNTNLGVSAGEDIVLGTIQAGNGNVALSAVGNIVDNETINTGRNVSANGLIMKAGGIIGGSDITSPSDINRHAISTAVTSLTAQSASGIYVQELDGLTVTSVVVPVTEVQFRGTTLGRTSTQEDLTTTSNGPIKVQSTDGDIVIEAGTSGGNGITANGTGDILLQTLNSGTVVLNSTIATGSGNITLAANDSMVIGDYLRTAAPGSIVVRSGGSVSIGDGGLSTNNANLALFAAGDISLGAINAGSGNVYLDATGSIARITPGKDEINITASTATILAGVKIGDADQTNIVNDYNFNAITTNVATLAARSATGIYIFEQTGVTVDRINTSIAEVHFNSTTTNLSTSTEDLVTTNQGPIKLLSLQGDIVINPGTLGSPGVNASGAGDVLLQTGLSGTLIANADIVSGSGDINVVTRGDLAIGDRLKTTAPGTIYLSSQGSVSISSMNIQGVELGVSANDDILVGQIDAGNAKVWLSSAANIFDNDNSNSTINITASAAILRASEKIGNSGVGTSNSRAITTRVETLSANADNGIYLQEQDGLSIDRVTSTVQRVYFNSNTAPLSLSQEDLTTSVNGPILLQSLQGDIVVRAGTDGEPGIWANGTGNVLLQTVSSGTIRAEADVRSDSGHITLNSFGDLVINEHIRTSSPGTIYLVSQGAISIESLTTNNTNLGVSAVGDIQLGSINAGTANVFLTTPGRILDNAALNTGRNITASGLTMFGEDGIGLSDTSSPVDTNRNAITTAVSTLSARSSGGIYVQELDGVSISTVVVPVRQVNFGSGASNRTVTREDLVTTLNTPIKLQSIDGDIAVNAGTSGTSGVLANGSGDILLQTLNSGTVILNSTVQSGSGDITIIADDSLNIADRIRTNSQGTIVLRSDESVSIGVGGMSTNNASLGVFAAGDIQVGSIQAGTGRVLLDAAGNISRATSGSNETNITGSAATLLAGGRIGDSDLGNINADSNRNAITTNITTLAARSGTGIFVSEQTGVTIDRVVTTLTEVHFNSTRTTLARATEDLTTTNNGSILLQSLNGDIVVRPGTDGEPGISANGTGNILLQTLNSGTILTQADVRSGSGHITLSSFDDLVVNERLQTSSPGTIYLNSLGTVSVQSLTTNNTNLGVSAGEDIVLGTIQAGNGNVALSAVGNIVDNETINTGRNVSAHGLIMKATGMIGGSDTTSPSDINRHAISTAITSLTAQSASGIYVQELDGLAVTSVVVPVTEVQFRGTTLGRTSTQEDLTTTINGPIKVQSTDGDIVVNGGTPGSNGVTANGTGDILLQTLNSGTVVLNSTVATGSGNITLAANGSMVIGDYLRTAAPGSIVLRSGGSVSIGDGGLSTNNANLALFAAGDISLGAINSGTGNVYLDATGRIARITPGKDEINITASTATLLAGVKIGDADQTNIVNDYNFNAITTNVATLAARSATGIYIFEQSGVTVDRIITSIAEVHFNSTTANTMIAVEDLTTTNNGSVLLQSLQGDILVRSGSAGEPGISADGNGNILLQTLQAGTIRTEGNIVSETGHISLNSHDDLTINERLATNGSGTIYLSSQGSVSIDSLHTTNTNLGVHAQRAILLGVIDAGSSNVSLDALGSILDNPSLNAGRNVTASGLTMIAKQFIGGTDLSGSIDANRNAITTSVEILSARSGAGIYLQELDGLTITSVTTPLSQVRFNGNVVDRTTTDEDLTTTNNGTILVQSLDEDIVVEAGFSGEPGIRANGSGNILLQTVHSGTVRTQADIVSDFGHITLSTHDDLVINEKLRTSSPGSIFLKSDESVFVESLETRDTNLGVVAGNDIQLGTIRAGQANITLTAQRDILDIRAIDSGRNIAANGLSMVAGNSIGASDLSGMPSGNRNAITTAVNTLAAHSATGVYVQELDGLTVTSVSTSPAAILSMAQVHFNGQLSDRSTTVEDLTTSSNGPIKLQSLTGDVVIGPGTSGTNGVTADGSGDILLETLDRGAVKLQAVVQAGSGHITVSSFNDIVVNDTLKTGGGGTVWIESQGDVSLATYRNFGSNLGVRAQGDILLGTVDVGGSQVYLNAANDIALARPIGSEPTIRSVAASLKAGGLIGASGVGGIGQYNPFALETQLDSLAAESRDGIFIRERDQITIDRIETELFRVHFNSSRSGFVESQEDLVTTVEGSIQLHAIAGDIHVLPGSVDAKGILANGRGDIDLRTIDQGSIFARATIESGSGRISLDALASVWIDKTVSTGGDIQLRGVEGSIDELSGDAKVIGDELTIISGAHTHLHDTTVRTLSGATGTNARLENWQQVNRLASEQGDDFLDALRTVDDAQRESLRSHYRFADRYETDGYSLYLVNSKALTVGTLVAGVSSSSPSGLDQPTIYVEASQGDLVVQHKLESMSRTSQAGGIVLVASGELGIGSQGVIQTRSIEDGQTHVQVINNIDLRARVFDALEKPNPTGGLFTTRIVSQNNLGESALPEVPVQAGPTKRQLQGVATHFGSVDEAGFNLFVGYADGKLEQFSDEGDVYQRDALDRMPVEARPQAVGAVGYLERSTPFTVDFLNSVQELPTDVIVRRSDDFFLFQGEVPGGLNTFNPPNPPAGTSTGFYDLTVQSHRVPDVISEGSDNGLPMPPPPEVDVPQSKQPEPYVVQDVQTTPVQSAEYEDEPLQDRKVRIVVARIRVAIEEQELENEDPEARNKRINKQYIEIELPDDILANDNQVSQSQINRIEDYLKKQPGTRAGRYVILEETSDGEKREIAYIVIGTEDNQPRSQKPQEEPSGSEPSESGAPNAPGQAPGSEDQARYETRPDSSLEKSGRDDVGTVNQDKAWGILLGAYWLSKNSERKDHQEREKPFAQANSVSESDFSSRARRMRRLNSAGQNCNEEQS